MTAPGQERPTAERPAAAVPAAAAPADADVVAELRGVGKTFVGGDGRPLTVLDGVDFTVRRGEMVAIVGASGAGKSTLLHVLGALEAPTRGEVVLGGVAVAGLDDEALAELRNRLVGFIFQFHHLLREFSAAENVAMPLRIAGVPAAEADARARRLLDRLGLAGRRTHRPGALSGGEQQRTAVARALARRPALLLADEPSGNLDAANAERLHALLASLAREEGVGLVVVTHNPALAALADRALSLEDGRLVPARVPAAGAAGAAAASSTPASPGPAAAGADAAGIPRSEARHAL